MNETITFPSALQATNYATGYYTYYTKQAPLKRLLRISNTQTANDHMSGWTYTCMRTVTTFGLIKLPLSYDLGTQFPRKHTKAHCLSQNQVIVYFASSTKRRDHSQLRIHCVGAEAGMISGRLWIIIQTGSMYVVSQNHVRVSPPSCDSEWPHPIPNPYWVYPQPWRWRQNISLQTPMT